MSKSVDQKLSEALDIEYNEKEIQKTDQDGALCLTCVKCV